MSTILKRSGERKRGGVWSREERARVLNLVRINLDTAEEEEEEEEMNSRAPLLPPWAVHNVAFLNGRDGRRRRRRRKRSLPSIPSPVRNG